MASENEVRVLRFTSTLYSSATFKRLLADENLSSVENIIEKYKGIVPDCNFNSFGELLASAYNSMCANYCNEYVFKNAVFSSLIKKYSLETTTIHNELKIGKSVADLVLVNGEVKVFEIKTELDTLSRLDVQVQEYRRVSEKVNLVVNQKHVSQIENQFANSSVGIILIDSKQKLDVIKEANSDKSNFDFDVLFRLLRKNEYIEIIKEELGIVLNVPNTVIYKESESLLKTFELTKFQRLVFAKIKLRKIKEPKLLMNTNAPSALRFMLHCLNLNAAGYDNFFSLINQKV